MKWVFFWILAMILIFAGTGWITYEVFAAGEDQAEKACAAAGATPIYTKNTHYICVTSDGRVVGHG